MQPKIVYSRFPRSWDLSANFLAAFIIFLGTGIGLFAGWLDLPVAVFVFVLTGWIVSLCLHEGAHAFAAYWGGDRSVAAKGYLSLEPLTYTQPFLSFVLPLLYLILGGIGLPGGAVSIDHSVLKSKRWQAFVSAAGPLANLVFLIILTIPFLLGLPDDGSRFWQAVALLGALQASAVVLNLLPVPGLDGFGILRPYLPRDMQMQANQIAPMLSVLLLMMFISHSANKALWSAVYELTDFFAVDRFLIFEGWKSFRFWM
ncbi:site-2 protease family protein [Rhizobium jaguaris]|uniref:Site-2 protease family protein n=1 Tax=Rhizobium jaguaris TaxID=1312183 RepID=A0A387FYZ2_9HYPH|nr:site-2 protease family protein [Rhizobium jaguaris]AYG62445.1 site-2 protease family protein [Rhizobium jaguaris]